MMKYLQGCGISEFKTLSEQLLQLEHDVDGHCRERAKAEGDSDKKPDGSEIEPVDRKQCTAGARGMVDVSCSFGWSLACRTITGIQRRRAARRRRGTRSPGWRHTRSIRRR